jgi:hypothetical protein
MFDCPYSETQTVFKPEFTHFSRGFTGRSPQVHRNVNEPHGSALQSITDFPQSCPSRRSNMRMKFSINKFPVSAASTRNVQDEQHEIVI